jgi:CheY-like chemotaxis protein
MGMGGSMINSAGISSEMLRVVVFDDSQAAQAQYRTLFEDCGVHLLFLDDPSINDRVRRELIALDPQLLIVDLILSQSRLDGLNLVRELQSIRELKAVPIVVCSKLILNAPGAEPMGRVLKMPGVVAALPKTPEYPSAQEFLRYARKSPSKPPKKH